MAGEWDGSPRAVIPDEQLLDSKVPILASGTHLIQSPLPIGLAITMDDDLLPMYYVSPNVAKMRGRGVREGWYVVAELGHTFAIRFTSARGDKLSDLAACHERIAKIYVDGTNIGITHNSWILACPRNDVDCRGFQVGIDFEAGSMRGQSTFRRFRFAKAKTVTESKGASVAPPNTGSIRLEIFEALMVSTGLSERKFVSKAPGPTTVHEKHAIKRGLSVCVDSSDEVSNMKFARSRFTPLYDGPAVGTVEIFLRERYWMESRCIIDSQGDVWKPSKIEAPIDLTGRNAETSTEPSPKRIKLEKL